MQVCFCIEVVEVVFVVQCCVGFVGELVDQLEVGVVVCCGVFCFGIVEVDDQFDYDVLKVVMVVWVQKKKNLLGKLWWVVLIVL